MAEREEVWRPVSRGNGLYEVSNLGRVRSLPRSTTQGRILKMSPNSRGYPSVSISVDGARKTTGVHRLVAEAFIHPVKGSNQINHIDGDKANNFASNLEWVTQLENNLHSVNVLKRLGGNRKLDLRQVQEIRQLFRTGLTNKEIARKYKLHHSTITKIRSGRLWQRFDEDRELGENVIRLVRKIDQELPDEPA